MGTISTITGGFERLTEAMMGWHGMLTVDYQGPNSLLGVDGLYSQRYGKGVFIFLVASLLIFVGIMWLYWTKSKSSIKRGEVVMFGAILMGVIFAFVFGYIQMVQGYLF